MANSDRPKKLPYLLLDKRRYNKDLSVIRESYGEVNEQLLEVCCRMQRHFDPKDLKQAVSLAAELNTLKACEEKLEQLEEALRWGLRDRGEEISCGVSEKKARRSSG